MSEDQDLRDILRHLRVRESVLRRSRIAADDVGGLHVVTEFGPDVVAVFGCQPSLFLACILMRLDPKGMGPPTG